MSIYSETSASDLARCLDSLSRQTMPAAEVILVRDGPVDPSVERCIQSYDTTFLFRHLYLPHNRGLGQALRDGLKRCSHGLIARVDSDDWIVPERFATQTTFLDRNPSISLVGGALRERYKVGKDVISLIRRNPTDHTSIEKVARRRNPINHPTVMFRKSAVMACDSYEPCPLFEDYYLWAKMLAQGYLLSNLPEVLVETDADSDYFRRRGGIIYIKNELRLVKKLRRIGFLSPVEAGVFLLTRLPIRLVPVVLRQHFYKTFLRTA